MAKAKKKTKSKVVQKKSIKKAPKKAVKTAVKKSSTGKAAKKASQKAAKPAPKKAVKKAVKKVLKKATQKVASKPKPKLKTKGQATAKVSEKTSVKKSEPSWTQSLEKALSPLDDRLVVQVAEAEKMTAGGLFIPSTVSDVSGNLKGRVVAIGRGHQNKKGHIKPMDVQVGQTVLFSEYAGTKYNHLGTEVIIIRESDVLGIVE